MSMPSPTDLELVHGLHARDPKALARVYGDYHAGIYNLCARILGDREEAQDVTQDVFVKAFSKPPAVVEDVRLRPWLFRVATNACLNLIRGRRTGDPVAAEGLAASGDPYEQARTAALIETSLAGMNERYRAALVLKDLHGLEGRELAEVLEVSRPAADVLVHRARASFRRVFTRLAGDDAVVPANLALALPLLPVPAALAALPLPLHTPPPAVANGAGPAIASGAGPAAGLLTKIGAALSTKAAVVAAGAAIVAGGGVAAVKLAGGDHSLPPASAGGAPAAAQDGAGAGGTDHAWDDSWPEHRRAIAAHHAAHHAAESGHDSAGHDSGSGTHDTGDQGHTSTTTHDSTHDSTTTAPSGTTSTGTGTHDGGDSGHDGSEH
jgi:RNA polymerase sigma-70 factor (ECF subfamily)